MSLVLVFCAAWLGYRPAKPHWLATPFWAAMTLLVLVHC